MNIEQKCTDNMEKNIQGEKSPMTRANNNRANIKLRTPNCF